MKKRSKKKIRVHRVRGPKVIKRKPRTKKKNNLKYILLIISLIVVIVLKFSIDYVEKKNKVNFKLLGEENIIIDVFGEYAENGAKLVKNDIDISSELKIRGEVATNKIGEYKIEYIYNDKVYDTRIVKVIDKESPVITLNGESIVKIIETSIYTELKATAQDNYDGDLTGFIEIEGNVDTNKVGEYTLNYNVKDSSNNISTVTRTIIVEEKPKEIIKTIAHEENKYVPPVVIVEGRITSASFTNSGIYLEGCATTNEIPKEILVKDNKYTNFNINSNCYNITLDVTSFSNGTYPILLVTDKSTSNIVNELAPLARINRAKIGDKLVSIDYTNNNMSINISDFAYQYDVIIDAGHGGFDSGATNAYIEEKRMNLEVALYEKSLFEAAGYRVLLIRDNDTYGNGISVNEKALYNRAYYMGYYGVVSKVVYSIHHNANSNSNVAGFEMYITNQTNNMTTEINIFNNVKNIFNSTAIMGRNYDTEQIYNKTAGNYINARNYYAVIRIPYELFNVNNVTIYEGCYLSNINDFIAYWNNGLWRDISKIKVNNYIEKIKSM